MSSFEQKVIKHKIGLLNLAAELGNILRLQGDGVFLAILFIAIKLPLRQEVLRL